MPLRSVEAATREDAIAAAREQFGPHARVVGVRRVRSGGVLGFFATERYIAEVAPHQQVRPGVPAPSSGPAPAAPTWSYDSPLASASPARAGAAAPARNGAAAWAAEAARSGSAPSSGVTGRSPAAREVPAGPAPSGPAVDDDRLDELAGLLGAAPGTTAAAPPSTPTPEDDDRDWFPRAVFPTAVREPVALRTEDVPAAATSCSGRRAETPATTPSPFTAALARMVSGDREVRQAVAEALEEPVALADPMPATPAPGRSAAETVAECLPAAEEAVGAASGVTTDVVAAVPAEVVASATAELIEMAPLLARTASDPAPRSMSLDATTVMPRMSLLPSLAGSRVRGLPPVPPSPSRPAVPSSRGAAPSAAADTVQDSAVAPGPARETSAPVIRTLATVTRLPVGPLLAGEESPGLADETAEDPVTTATTAPAAEAAAGPAVPGDVVARLVELGLPRELLGDDAAARIATAGTYAALTGGLASRLPEAPELPSGAGEVLFLVGPGVETLRAARALAASLRLDPERVQWATRGDLAGLAPKGSRMTTVDAATDRRQEAAGAGSITIVAVDAPLRSDGYWLAQMLAIWSPVAVWAVVEATRKPEDVELWLDGLARVDALVVQDTDLSTDPAAVLQRLTVPVALLDGVRATPHRWASLLCERLDGSQI